MERYLAVFKISLRQELAYKLNFLMWRFRNLIQFFLLFFLWDSLFSDPSKQIFGYDRAKVLTYVFGILIIKALVYSGRSLDISGEIARGDLSNFLLKPISYFRYWFAKDFSSKLLNITFAVLETVILYFILKPSFFFQTNLEYLIPFLVSLILAIILYFLVVFLFSMLPFWLPEQAWGSMFLFLIFSDFLGGGIFPLDILPFAVQRIIYLTPFPYLVFVPLQIYLGKLTLSQVSGALMITLGWMIILFFSIKNVWLLGLKTYRAEGR